MKKEVISLKDKFQQVEGFWTPKIIEQINDYHVKVAKFKGEFTWHSHEETDELFMVIEGQMTIMFEDHSVQLKSGDLYVVEKGVEHKPVAADECQVLLLEPKGTINTGQVVNEQTASNSEWI